MRVCYRGRSEASRPKSACRKAGGIHEVKRSFSGLSVQLMQRSPGKLRKQDLAERTSHLSVIFRYQALALRLTTTPAATKRVLRGYVGRGPINVEAFIRYLCRICYVNRSDSLITNLRMRSHWTRSSKVCLVSLGRKCWPSNSG